MHRLAGRAVFSVGAATYLWEDVLLAAHLWSEWGPLTVRATEGIACRKHLGKQDEAPADDEIDELGEAWRYERDLLSADDMQVWLSERRLEMDEWNDYIDRAAARRRCAADVARIAKAVPAAEVDAVLYAEAMCSGILGDLAGALAARVAVHERLASEEKTGAKTRSRAALAARPSWCSKTALRPLMARLPRSVKQDGMLSLGAAKAVERAEALACVTLSFDRFVDRVAAPAAVAREVEAHPLDWTRIDADTVAFNVEETAREAALLVREDGLELAKAASVAHAAVAKAQYVIEETASPLRERLVAALPGDLIGPVATEAGFLLIAVAKRTEPSAGNAMIRDRARQQLVGRTIQREITERVQWHERV